MNKPRIIGVIPARYSSTRLPGKPLVDICGLPMVVHVMKRAMMSDILDDVIVATDDKRIFDVVLKHGGKAAMTSKEHQNATTRLYEVVSQGNIADIYILILGDEALVKPEHLTMSANSLIKQNYGVSLLYNKFYTKNSPTDQKVAINNLGEIMFISRSDIPSDYKTKVDFYYKAFFIVSFTHEMLEKYMTLSQTRYDFIESNEFTRILEHGYKIIGVEVENSSVSVDTPEDLEKVREMMEEDELFKKYKDCKID